MYRKAYLESKVLSADPIELIQLLYRGAIQAVLDARSYLARGEIARRSAAISKCLAILAELNASLNHQDGGELSDNLGRLYDYMQRRLLEANLRQADQPLAETLSLLATLAEAWEGVQRANQPGPGGQAQTSGWESEFAEAQASTPAAHCWNG